MVRSTVARVDLAALQAASEMAGALGAIPYGVLGRIGSRIERIYDGAASR